MHRIWSTHNVFIAGGPHLWTGENASVIMILPTKSRGKKNFSIDVIILKEIFSKPLVLYSDKLGSFPESCDWAVFIWGDNKEDYLGWRLKSKDRNRGEPTTNYLRKKNTVVEEIYVFLKKNIYCRKNIFVCVCTHSEWYLPRHSICIPNVIFAGGCTHICQIGVKIWNVFCGINVMVPISMNHCLSSPPTQ